ncbi:hypothetical protein E4U32_007394 [Claviceps aff. humidiphila group G2b]|nr:hypothetical protein E4U32_007394 [Claviceps aff. humidiphila group G2b]
MSFGRKAINLRIAFLPKDIASRALQRVYNCTASGRVQPSLRLIAFLPKDIASRALQRVYSIRQGPAQPLAPEDGSGGRSEAPLPAPSGILDRIYSEHSDWRAEGMRANREVQTHSNFSPLPLACGTQGCNLTSAPRATSAPRYSLADPPARQSE